MKAEETSGHQLNPLFVGLIETNAHLAAARIVPSRIVVMRPMGDSNWISVLLLLVFRQAIRIRVGACTQAHSLLASVIESIYVSITTVPHKHPQATFIREVNHNLTASVPAEKNNPTVYIWSLKDQCSQSFAYAYKLGCCAYVNTSNGRRAAT